MRRARVFVADTKQNDLGYFPSGIPHSIQGLEPDGAEFLLLFDDGDFSESETVLLSDSMAHLPPGVLSKKFGVAEVALKKTPQAGVVHFPGCSSRTTGGRPESSGGSPWEVAVRFRISHDGNAADEAHERRRGTDR